MQMHILAGDCACPFREHAVRSLVRGQLNLSGVSACRSWRRGSSESEFRRSVASTDRDLIRSARQIQSGRPAVMSSRVTHNHKDTGPLTSTPETRSRNGQFRPDWCTEKAMVCPDSDPPSRLAPRLRPDWDQAIIPQCLGKIWF